MEKSEVIHRMPIKMAVEKVVEVCLKVNWNLLQFVQPTIRHQQQQLESPTNILNNDTFQRLLHMEIIDARICSMWRLFCSHNF